eukprot:jgi/Pico_ML_1/52732/g3397.t1
MATNTATATITRGTKNTIMGAKRTSAKTFITKHLEIKDVGNWWDAVERSEWPTDQEAQKSILNDFSKDESIGDRRQELVFIGIGMEQATIESSLDQALLSDEELGEYKEYWTC